MGVDLFLEDERGAQIAGVLDPANTLVRLIMRTPDAGSRCLKYVDPYGDTVFNQLQIGDLLDELRALRVGQRTDDERNHLDKVIELAERCQGSTHHYLKFHGD
jgi:hypothetical protein